MVDEARTSSETLTVEDMQRWLQDEIRDSAKAHELRVKDARDFVDAYSSGKISSVKLEERLLKYSRRWGEALYGSSASNGLTDDAILNAIDRAREMARGKHTERLVDKTERASKQSL